MPKDESSTLPQLPSHWNVPNSQHPLFGPFPRLLFQGLCLISVHRPSLDHHWKSKCDDGEWYKHMNEMVGQINNSNVAVGSNSILCRATHTDRRSERITFGHDSSVFNNDASRAISFKLYYHILICPCAYLIRSCTWWHSHWYRCNSNIPILR